MQRNSLCLQLSLALLIVACCLLPSNAFNGGSAMLRGGVHKRQQCCSAVSSMRSSAGSPFKLLILHGKGDNGPKFAKRIAKIEDALAAEREIECVYLDGPVELAEDQYAWWNLPPGARSFTTDKYLEVDETFKVIEETWKEEGPFNAILAHSQGAILTTVLLAKAVKEGFIARPDKAILFGNAWP